MPHISLRVSEQEKNWMDSYAKVNGKSISDVIKDAFFEMLENEYDLKTIREHEAEKENGNARFYSHDEVGRILGLK